MVDALFPKMSKNFLNPLLAEKITGEESSSEKESLQYFSHSSTNQARPCLASKIRWDRARSGWCGHRLFSISNWTFSLLGNSKCHWDCVGTSFIQRYGNDLDELWNTHHVPSFSVSWQEETAVVERKNGSSRILKVKPFLWVHFCWNQQSQIVQIKW